jgi:hypothetical protein
MRLPLWVGMSADDVAVVVGATLGAVGAEARRPASLQA